MRTIIIAAFLAIFFIAGCSPQSQQSQATTEVKKKLVIGTGTGYYPFAMMDKTGKLIGHDLDLSNELGKYLNMEVEFQGFDSVVNLISAIHANKVDMIAGGISITEKRQEVMNFSDPYFENYISVVVNSSNKDTRDWRELDKPGVTIGVSLGSGGDTAAQKYFEAATIKKFEGPALLGQAMLNGQVDAILFDSTWVNVFKVYNPDSVRILTAKLGEPEFAGLGVSKGNKELLDKVNAFLKQYKESGAAAKNYEKWFISDAWKELVPPKKYN